MIVLLENIGNLLKESSVFIFNARTLSSNTHLWNFITSNCKNIHTFGYDSNWIYKKIDVTTINRFDLLFRSTVYESKKLSETSVWDLKNLLSKYSLNNSIDLLNKNYGAFEIKQKNEEPKKEEN